MKKYLILLLLTLRIFSAKSQVNLVPNFSFEDKFNCINNNYFLEQFIYNWSGGKGYYNTCRALNFGVPNNISGYQNPKTGNAYCGIYTIASGGGQLRQYIQVKLKETLQVNNSYRVQFYVSLGDTFHANCNSIGAYFSLDSFFVSNDGLIEQIPQVQNHEENDLSSKTEWTLVCDTFVAAGNERYITIGNFYNDSQSVFTPLDSVCSLPNPFNCASYYYIDDVSVTLIDETGIEEHNQNYYIIYPNPNGGAFELITTSNNLIRCELSDIIGRVFEIGNYKPSGNKVPFSFQNLPKGIYNLKIIDSNKSTTIKIVIN